MPRDNLPSDETIASMKQALAKAMPAADLQKAGINVASNITWYDLRTPALLHVPVITPLRDKLPRTQRANPGPAANWKVIPNSQVVGSGYDSIGYVPEGARSAVMSVSANTKTSSYITLGEEGDVTWEARNSARPMEDANALARLLTLEKVMLKEEPALLFGNKSNKLGTPTISATAAPTTTGATITATTYYIAVVALTGEGMMNSSLAGGIATQKTVTGADGKQYTVNGGSSQKSAISSQAVSSGDALSATVTPIKGALGYAWFVGTVNAAASLYLQAITTTNSLLLLTTPVTTTQTADQITADLSVNDGSTGSGTNQVTAMDGVMTQSNLNGGYFIDLAGASLTSSTDGTIEELDDMFMTLWNTYRLGVDTLWMSAKTAQKIRKLILNAGSAPLVRIERALDGGGAVGGGSYAATYLNPVSVFGGEKIPLMVHPNLPDGVIVGYASKLPGWYKSNETPVVAEVLTRQDYYAVEWPIKTRADEYGVYTDETLAVYAPFATAVICNFPVT